MTYPKIDVKTITNLEQLGQRCLALAKMLQDKDPSIAQIKKHLNTFGTLLSTLGNTINNFSPSKITTITTSLMEPVDNLDGVFYQLLNAVDICEVNNENFEQVNFSLSITDEMLAILRRISTNPVSFFMITGSVFGFEKKISLWESIGEATQKQLIKEIQIRMEQIRESRDFLSQKSKTQETEKAINQFSANITENAWTLMGVLTIEQGLSIIAEANSPDDVHYPLFLASFLKRVIPLAAMINDHELKNDYIEKVNTGIANLNKYREEFKTKKKKPSQYHEFLSHLEDGYCFDEQGKILLIQTQAPVVSGSEKENNSIVDNKSTASSEAAADDDNLSQKTDESADVEGAELAFPFNISPDLFDDNDNQSEDLFTLKDYVVIKPVAASVNDSTRRADSDITHSFIDHTGDTLHSVLNVQETTVDSSQSAQKVVQQDIDTQPSAEASATIPVVNLSTSTYSGSMSSGFYELDRAKRQQNDIVSFLKNDTDETLILHGIYDIITFKSFASVKRKTELLTQALDNPQCIVPIKKPASKKPQPILSPNQQLALVCMANICKHDHPKSPDEIVLNIERRLKTRGVVTPNNRIDIIQDKLYKHLLAVYQGRVSDIDTTLFKQTIDESYRAVAQLRDKLIHDFDAIVESAADLKRPSKPIIITKCIPTFMLPRIRREHYPVGETMHAARENLINNPNPTLQDCWAFTRVVQQETAKRAPSSTTSALMNWVHEAWNSFRAFLGLEVKRTHVTATHVLNVTALKYESALSKALPTRTLPTLTRQV